MKYVLTFASEIDAQVEAASPKEAKALAMKICYEGKGQNIMTSLNFQMYM